MGAKWVALARAAGGGGDPSMACTLVLGSPAGGGGVTGHRRGQNSIGRGWLVSWWSGLQVQVQGERDQQTIPEPY